MRSFSVLIIDDSEADRFLLKRLLRKGDVSNDVFEASDGGEALDFLADRVGGETKFPGRFPPLVIFLDINMPGVDGFEFLERFAETREREGYESIVFLMFTSSSRDEDRRRASAHSFVRGFVTKMPQSAESLRDQVLDALAA